MEGSRRPEGRDLSFPIKDFTLSLLGSLGISGSTGGGGGAGTGENSRMDLEQCICLKFI